MVSINSEWWDWGDEDAPQSRYKGKIVKWQSKSAGSEQLSIQWENGIVDGAMQEGYAEAEKADLSKVSTRGGKALTEPKFSFQLEPYEDGAPAPTLFQKEVTVGCCTLLAHQPRLLQNAGRQGICSRGCGACY